VLPAIRALARQPFLVPLLGLACLQALSLSVYDTFLSVHVHALGLPATVVGWAVAVGVVCEIAVMGVGRELLTRFGATRAIVFASLLGVPRWALTAWVTSPVALVAIQALHGVTFGVFWIAGVQVMAERAPMRVAASAQSLFVAASYGVGALIGALLAGEVRELWGTGAIFQMLTVASAGASACGAALVWRERTAAPAEA
jgi:PPP family 3-phenylpropionic acid transporter